ncbi:MAG: methyltransferase domain-containing protein [Myxococcota bacterium]
MDPTFWLKAWEEGRTAFHQEQVHPELIRCADRFLPGRHRVLVPLCGKSLDLTWLASRGHEVVGVELAEAAITALFARGRTPPARAAVGPYEAWTVENLTVLQGDVLELDPTHAGTFDRVWDRASLVALDPDRRVRYVAALRRVLRPGAVVLLETFEYEQARKPGPPHAVPEAEVRTLWAGAGVEPLSERDDTTGARARGWDVGPFSVHTWMITLPG